MDYFCISDIGLIREKNQDSYLAIENNYGDLLMLVADGIGGGKAGEIASSETIRYFDNNFKESGPFSSVNDIKDYLSFHINQANIKVFEESINNKDYYGMGTTLTGILISKIGNVVINIGDSRVYGLNNENIHQLTNDHTLVNEMLSKGQISPEEAINHPKKHYLVRAIGIFSNVNPDIYEVDKYDYYLVCSDGLHGYVSNDEIKEIILDENKTLEDKVIDLKDLALLKGGYDNVTVVLNKD